VPYLVLLKKSAEKELGKLPLSAVMNVRDKIRELASNPFPKDFKKLQGFTNQYRIRSGNYRLIYSVYSKQLVIEILKIGDRKNIYG
jgi:mRNA interferase RelE/StbE